MTTLAVNTAILDGEKVLLTKRADFEVWCLPGGGVDRGETVAQAARREVLEEVGLQVELDGLVGIYSRPGWMNGGLHVVLFTARPTGGVLRPQPEEVMEAAYFGLDELPEDLMFGHRQRILDAVNRQSGGVAWLQDAEWDFNPQLTRQELYSLRDKSGLSKSEYYFRRVGRPSVRGEQLEVG